MTKPETERRCVALFRSCGKVLPAKSKTIERLYRQYEKSFLISLDRTIVPESKRHCELNLVGVTQDADRLIDAAVASGASLCSAAECITLIDANLELSSDLDNATDEP